MYNYMTIVGNLTKDPATHLTKDKQTVVRFTLANDYRKGDEKKVLYLDVSVFGKLCTLAQNYLKKGSKCLVGGRVESNRWMDDTGKDRVSYCLVAFSLECLDSKEAPKKPENNEDEDLPF